MWIFRAFVGALMSVTLTNTQMPLERRTLFDFRTLSNVDDWTESSDTVRMLGMSKAVLTLQKTALLQRAVFFSLLNPQSNGAGFAGVRTPVNFDLRGYRAIEVSCRAQGQNGNYKVVLRHRGLSADSDVSYEQFFSVSTTEPLVGPVNLPLAAFKPYFRGREQPDAEPLDISNVTMFGLQIYGGVYSPVKQRGVSALEIDAIYAVPA